MVTTGFNKQASEYTIGYPEDRRTRPTKWVKAGIKVKMRAKHRDLLQMLSIPPVTYSLLSGMAQLHLPLSAAQDNIYLSGAKSSAKELSPAILRRCRALTYHQIL